MPEGTEFSRWGIPSGWRKWFYGGAVGLLLVTNVWTQSKLEDCWDRNDELRDKSDSRLEKWVDRWVENKLNQAEEERINPKVEEIKGIVDSLKTRTP